MGKHRGGIGEFQAPYGVAYEGLYYDSAEDANAAWGSHIAQKKESLQSTNSDAKYAEAVAAELATPSSKKDQKSFTLGVLCIPTKPGWSRAIIMTGTQAKEPKAKTKQAEPTPNTKKTASKKKKKVSMVARIFGLLPVWVLHLLSNKFLDSDLAFLHYQEQERLRYCSSNSTATGKSSSSSVNAYYYMPTEADRCIAMLRKWIPRHTDYLGSSEDEQQHHSRKNTRIYELPPPITDTNKLFDRYLQHTSHCRHCQNGLLLFTNTAPKVAWAGLVTSVVVGHFVRKPFPGLLAKLGALGCLGILRILPTLERAFRVGGFQHHTND